MRERQEAESETALRLPNRYLARSVRRPLVAADRARHDGARAAHVQRISTLRRGDFHQYSRGPPSPPGSMRHHRRRACNGRWSQNQLSPHSQGHCAGADDAGALYLGRASRIHRRAGFDGERDGAKPWGDPRRNLPALAAAGFHTADSAIYFPAKFPKGHRRP